jgi:hypothetical protein
MGKTVTPVPFRGPTLPAGGPGVSRIGRLVRIAFVVMMVAVGSLVAFHFRGQLPGLGVTAGGGGSGAAVSPQGPPAGYEESASPLGSPPGVPAIPEGAAYRFSAHQDGIDDPVTWSPCRPIHYVMREANEPPGGDDLVRQGIAEVSYATGLQFVEDGTTDEGPSEDRNPYQPERYGSRWAPVLIAWATPDEVPDFGIDIAGEAGPIRVATPDGSLAFVSGVVYLDPGKLGPAMMTSDVAVVRAIVIHELGHLVGLAHVNDPQSVMFPRSSAQASEYGPGDRAGLAALGRGACQPMI